MLNPLPIQQPPVPILVRGGGEQATLRFAARYADASNLGAVSRNQGNVSADVIVRKLAALDGHLADVGRPVDAVLRTGLLTAFLSKNRAAARAKLANLPPAMAAQHGQLPVIDSTAEAMTQVRASVAAGMRYVILIVMPGDVETLRILVERVIPGLCEPA